jgi:hypothetical protein
LENKWDDIRELLLRNIKMSLEKGEIEKGQTEYWVNILTKFCHTEKTYFRQQ